MAAARTAASLPRPHPTLTLVLACRTESNAQAARKAILERHAADLAKRRRRSQPVPYGWEEGLRVEYELVDLDSVGGDRGVLAFAERVRARYPHITSLFLNAGYAAFTRVDIPKALLQFATEGLRALYRPRFNDENVGERSRDGERGSVWGVNVLAPYLLAKELAVLLRASPRALPFEPRVVYTSSIEADAEGLKANPLDDYQLLTYAESYRASKYMGDLVFTALDRDAELGQAAERPVRCLIAEPGCVATNIAVSGFGAWAWVVSFKWYAYWAVFFLANLFGSPYHPVYATAGAAPMLYAALVADTFLLAADKVPAPKLRVVAHPLQRPTVKYGEVDQWEGHQDVADGVAERCEAFRVEWHKREAEGNGEKANGAKA